jgi:DNA-binding winged helix-turn-helix (wHTH) protein
VLQFDRFTLDLTRGCLRLADQDIPLRPKTFEVLRHLAQNTGRLVAKQEFLEIVWSGIAVSDDSLLQCIRELRQKLGSDGHRLIKTVPRRGYLLDARPAAPAKSASSWIEAISGWLTPYRVIGGNLAWGASMRNSIRAQRRWLSAAIAGVACLALSVGYLIAFHGAAASTSEFFTEEDKERLVAVAASKQLPLPSFEIERPDATVSAKDRSFVGIWVSEKGWFGSNRQMMLIVTSANNGTLKGYVVHGPPQQGSAIQSPAHFRTFKTKATGRSFSYDDASGIYTASFLGDDLVQFNVEYRHGQVGFVILHPFWTLVAAERRGLHPR